MRESWAMHYRKGFHINIFRQHIIEMGNSYLVTASCLRAPKTYFARFLAVLGLVVYYTLPRIGPVEGLFVTYNSVYCFETYTCVVSILLRRKFQLRKWLF